MALTIFFDNYIVDVIFKRRSPFSQKIVYAFLSLAMVLIIAIFCPIQNIGFKSALMFILAGATYALALVPYYFSLKSENATASEIFQQTQPIFNLLLGLIFLGEHLNTTQLVAFVIILMASFVVVASKNKREKKASIKAIIYTTLAVILWAVSDLFFVYGGEDCDYMTILMYVLIGRCIVDFAVTAICKKEREYCFKIAKKNGLKAWGAMIADFIMEIGADLLFKLTLLMGPMALIAAVEMSAELIFTFLFGVILTLLSPKFGREKLTKKNITTHLVAIFLLIIGIILIQ